MLQTGEEIAKLLLIKSLTFVFSCRAHQLLSCLLVARDLLLLVHQYSSLGT